MDVISRVGAEFLKGALRWWNHDGGIFPWAENNQGLISVLALIAALGLALFEQRRALVAEARARQAAEEAKVIAAAEAREAEITRRLSGVAEFAAAVRGVVVDVERDLAKDLELSRGFMFDGMTFQVPDDRVRQGARASADTLNALIAAAPLSPLLIRATRQGVSALLAISHQPETVHLGDFEEVYAGWRDGLEAARARVTDAELEFIYRWRPPPPVQMTDLTDAQDLHTSWAG
jgi:hypothetical protein